MKGSSFYKHLASMPDRRRDQGKRFSLPSLMGLAVCATLCGRTGLRGMVEWAGSVNDDVRRALGLRSAPGLGTMSRFLAGADVDGFERAWSAWVQEALPTKSGLRAAALDGKSLRGSRVDGEGMTHLIAVFSPEERVVLAQAVVDTKTNEHKAALALLKNLILKDMVVTGDAAFTQRDLCEQVVQAKGHYALAVKQNQPTLLETCQAAFGPPDSPSGDLIQETYGSHSKDCR